MPPLLTTDRSWIDEYRGKLINNRTFVLTKAALFLVILAFIIIFIEIFIIVADE
jgi:hypothetical protein